MVYLVQVAADTAWAAVLMSCNTSSGRETMATWLVGTSTVVAPMRAANCRWASDGITWSPSATRNQDGSALHPRLGGGWGGLVLGHPKSLNQAN